MRDQPVVDLGERDSEVVRYPDIAERIRESKGARHPRHET